MISRGDSCKHPSLEGAKSQVGERSKSETFNNNMNSQGTERVNEEGATETKVETVDYRSQAGQNEPNKENVGVVHLTRHKKDSGTRDGILARTAAAVTNTIKSAKDAIMGRGKDKDSSSTTTD